VGVGTYKQGTVIAITGNTGTVTTGPHLHVQMLRSNGSRIDPETYAWGAAGAPIPTPGFKFNRDLWYGLTHSDVVQLQNKLKSLGHFPTGTISTGYFGSVTLGAVQSFQRKYKIAGPGVAGYGRVGPITRGKLNSL